MAKNQVAETLLKQLKNPFDPKFVKWRIGATNSDKTKGIALAYIDSREVKKRLDDVCGVENWRDRLIPIDGGFISEIDIRIDGEWITRSNAAGNTKVEPIKGGASDAFKRTAAKWGVGHYLYYLPTLWVAIKQQGKNSRGEPIYVLSESPLLPDWAKPGEVENWEDVAELLADASSGEDGFDADEVIDNVDKIRSSTSNEELDMVVESFSSDERFMLANQIQVKRRELIHAGNIQPDNS